MRPLLAHCHFGLGKLSPHRQAQAGAAAHRDRNALYRDMGMTYWLEQAEVETRQLQ